ncbi:MAG: hypothetical protein ACOCRK_06455 [bacterium]
MYVVKCPICNQENDITSWHHSTNQTAGFSVCTTLYQIIDGDVIESNFICPNCGEVAYIRKEHCYDFVSISKEQLIIEY